MLSIIYGIASALSWGSGDFAGGLSSRKVGAYRAVLYADFFGLLILLVISLFYHEPLPSARGLISSLLGGALGSFGLLILYHSLSIGEMSIAAPVSALFAALLPVLFSAFVEGLPSALQSAGFALALGAVWLISQADGQFQVGRLSDLRLPILAGFGFGSYFIFINHAASDPDSLLWPMLISRAAGTAMLLVIVLLRRESLPVPRHAWGVVFLNTTLDLGGNLFFILASKAGRLDIAAILSSLYPGATVVLAWLILKEQLSSRQVAGIGLAFAAIFLFTL